MIDRDPDLEIVSLVESALIQADAMQSVHSYRALAIAAVRAIERECLVDSQRLVLVCDTPENILKPRQPVS